MIGSPGIWRRSRGDVAGFHPKLNNEAFVLECLWAG